MHENSSSAFALYSYVQLSTTHAQVLDKYFSSVCGYMSAAEWHRVQLRDKQTKATAAQG